MKIDISKKSCLAFLLICFIILSAIACAVDFRMEQTFCPQPLSAEKLDCIGDATKLMIVAHPDDETIWGGAHLLDGGYFVLCITNGKNKRRADEFRRAVEKSGNTSLILDYPDKTNFVRNDWNYSKEGIEADIQLVLSAKHWDFVVTHNPDGEYGHIHHKMTNALTVQAFEQTHSAEKLLFFGDYYKASDIGKAGDTVIPDETMREKLILCDMYSSQKRTMNKLSHMFPYENWKEYDE